MRTCLPGGPCGSQNRVAWQPHPAQVVPSLVLRGTLAPGEVPHLATGRVAPAQEGPAGWLLPCGTWAMFPSSAISLALSWDLLFAT